jgi:hypothetical protein
MNPVDLNGKSSEELCDLLHELCKTHDWTFMMSDDSRSYHKGQFHADQIEAVGRRLDNLGFGLTAKYIIEGWKPNSLKVVRNLV